MKKEKIFKSIKELRDGKEFENMEFDRNGNTVYYKYIETAETTIEVFSEYNENNMLIHSKRSDGYEEWIEYDDNGNTIRKYDNTGFEKRYQYDSKGKLVSERHSNGYRLDSVYNSESRPISNTTYYENSIYMVEKYDYDESGSIIKKTIEYYNSNGNIESICENYYEYYEEEEG